MLKKGIKTIALALIFGVTANAKVKGTDCNSSAWREEWEITRGMIPRKNFTFLPVYAILPSIGKR